MKSKTAVLTGSCHCGAVQVEIPRRPRSVTACNCSICRRYGTLWAYYKADDVRVTAKRGATQTYSWGDRRMRFVRCKTCGCIINWERIRPQPGARRGVNLRNFDPAMVDALRVRLLDGAKSWKYLN